MLKNKLFASAFILALVLGASVASAYSFPSKIDTKQEKMDVQTVLNMATGSTLTVDGVLGAKSIAAVKAFQTMKGLVADGLIGPMTRAALEAASVGGSTVSTVAGCAAGAAFSATTGAACTTTTTSTVAGCAAGAAFSATTGAACGTTTVVTPGTTMTGSTDGSLATPSQSSYISSGLTIKKGETKDVAAVHLQAISGPVAVKYVDVQFNVRPWLLFGAVTLHDSNGKVLATKTLSSIADTTEISVGNTYQVRFDGLNYVITPGSNVDLAVSASVLAATDKITDNMTVTSTITSIRTVSEVGYSNTTSANFQNTVTLKAAGSIADMYVRVSPSSPVAGQQVVNLTQVTSNVNLGIFSLKAANNNATVNNITVNAVDDNSSLTVDTNAHLTSHFSNFRLFVNGSSIAGGTVNGTSITFSNLTLPLTQDAWLDVTLMADVAANVSGAAHFTLQDIATVGGATPTAGLTVTDANYGTVTFSSANTASTNVITFTTNSITLGAVSASLGTAITNSNSTVGNNATYAFTLTNSSNNDLFVSSSPATFMPMTGINVGSSALSSVIASPSTVNGDTVSAFALPSGTSRTFTFSGALRGTGVTVTLKAGSIVYGTSAATPTGLSITTGLSGLSLTASY
jgi:peptidoglycan hydrolase-like protein with peptidoglycan-binding domain